MSSAGSQFLLLLWKNFKLQRRKKVVTVFELLVPTFFALLLLMIRGLADSNYVDNDSTWDRIFPACAEKPLNKTKIYYTPINPFTDSIIDGIILNTSQNITTTKQGFVSETLLIENWKNNDNKDLWAAVVFTSDTLSSSPLSLDYKLRVALRSASEDSDTWQTAHNYEVFATFGYRNNDSTGGEPYYYDTGFLCLQYYINKAFIEKHVPGALNGTQTALKKMLFPPFLNDVLATVLRSNLPLFLVLSFLLNALQISKDIAYEKEKKLKESMKMMGLSTSMYWLSWFAKCFIYMIIVIILYTIVFNIPIGSKGKILNYVQPSLFFCFLLCYVMATIAFCFMVCAFFSKANTAAFAGGVLFFLTYFPYFFLITKYETMTRREKMAASLLHNIGMALGVNTILVYEGTGDGAQWTNFYKPGTIDDNFSLLDSMTMLLVDTVTYMIIAWYVDTINPGDAGVAQPLWFPLMPSYWCGSKVHDGDGVDDSSVNRLYFEKDPCDAQVGISIRHLRKVFDGGLISRCKKIKSKMAVKDTTLNMFQGHITSLLGHNGAGKTTTISMLSGFLEPTSGTAIINGFDIRTDIANVRKKLGLCPQYNILFDLLTVEEHLHFFAILKGSDRKNVRKEINDMIKDLGLEHKRNSQSSTLSGGQKRKLSVGIALISDSKIVILDEPTSGMDPAARRQTWEILQRHRKGRTIILTTHFMDEADILGDRIAIMADGVVKCCGTSMFLKKLFGAGYHMVLVKSKSCDIDRLTALIQSHIPSATLESQISAEVSYLLPFNETSKFEKLFLSIETNMQELGVNSFGVSATTMEEVFLKVGENLSNEVVEITQTPGKKIFTASSKLPKLSFVKEDLNSTENTTKMASNGALKALEPASARQTTTNGTLKTGGPAIVTNCNQNSAFYNKVSPDSGVDLSDAPKDFAAYNKGITRNSGKTLAFQQFYGTFLKKFIHARRNFAVAAAQLILPIVFTIMGLSVEKVISNVGDEPALTLDLSPFSDNVVAYSDGISAASLALAYAAAYKTQFSGATSLVNRAKYNQMDQFFKNTIDDIGTATFNRRYIVAGDFESTGSQTVATAHYNGQPFHAIAISLNAIMNGLLKKAVNETLSINIVNHPLPKKISDNRVNLFYNINTSGFTVATSVLFGMAFMASSFIIFLIKERSVGAKHLQVVSGIGPYSYWLSTFIWDLINYTIPVLILLIVFAAFKTEAYVDDHRLKYVFLVLILYGWSVLPFVYLLHHLFNVPATGMVAVSMINLCSGLVLLMATYTLIIPALNTEKIGKALEMLFIIFLPNYNLGLALMDMYSNSGYKTQCESYNYKTVCASGTPMACCFPDNCGGKVCFTFYDNFLTWGKPGIGRECIFMFLQGIVFFSLVLMTELGLFRRLYSAIHRSARVEPITDQQEQPEDDDVSEEAKRINEKQDDDALEVDALILKNVTKVYSNGLHAVKGVSCGVQKNECFGLLGQNGAGKTSTFKILTGDEQMSSGDAYLYQFSVKRDVKKVQQILGYCPQFDALIDQMTGRETLCMFARFRGIPESQIKDTVNKIIETLMLQKHVDKQTGVYSGGNKRKLSTAIALIGDPPFVLLDEPTSGMDPGARRQLWNVLSDVRASGRTLVLTSHSMEECDALCTKIVIMVNGKFVCLGSPQHLKSKFGNGYTLFCRMGITSDGAICGIEPLVKFLSTHFPNTEVFDDNQGYVHLRIPDDNAKLAEIFGLMERSKEQYSVDDYSVHQTTLEQIFLKFTQKQIAPKEKTNKSCWNKCCSCCRKKTTT